MSTDITNHVTSLPTHRNSLPVPLASDPYETAIWCGLLNPCTPRGSNEAKSAERTIRCWLNEGAKVAAGKHVRANRPYMLGIYTGNRWIIPNQEIANFLERIGFSSEVAS